MLSDDEKEAIEQFKSWREYIIKHREETNQADDLEFYIRTILNLITKLEKENGEKDNNIEELKSKNKYLKLENEAYGKAIVEQDKKIKQKDKYIKNSEDITTDMKNDINKLLLEIKEKDKQIDIMLDKIDMTKPSPCTMTNEYSIGRVYMSKDEKRQYFEKQVKEKG